MAAVTDIDIKGLEGIELALRAIATGLNAEDYEDGVCRNSLEYVGMGLGDIANAINPGGEAPCPSGSGVVHSLTEAVMGVTAGLCQIAGGLHDVAEAIREGKE